MFLSSSFRLLRTHAGMRRALCSPQFSSIIDVVSSKNPQVHKSGVSPQINWNYVKDGKSIEGVMRKFNIPFTFSEKPFYPDQMQLYCSIIRLLSTQHTSPQSQEQQGIGKKTMQAFQQLHSSGVLRLADLKAASILKNDFAFNAFCIALFQGLQFLPQTAETSKQKSNLITSFVFLESLLNDRFPKSSFVSQILPHLSESEIEQICESLLTSGKGDLLMRIVTTTPEFLDPTIQLSLQEKFIERIPAKSISHLVNQSTYFAFHANKPLNTTEQQSHCLESIEVVFKQVKFQKNLLSTRYSFIHNYLKLVQKSGIQIPFKFLTLLTGSLKQDAQIEPETQLKLIDQLDLLVFEDSEKATSLLADFRVKLAQRSQENQSGRKELHTVQIQKLSRTLQSISGENRIKESEAFQILLQSLNESIDVTYSVGILTWIARSNKFAATLLRNSTEKFHKLSLSQIVEESLMNFSELSFSQVIFLKQQNILQISIDHLASYIESKQLKFSSILLVQSFYTLLSSNFTNKDLIDSLRKRIFELGSQLKFEDLTLLMKSIQFAKSKEETQTLQDFLEIHIKSRLSTETKYINMYFQLTYHKIIKDGMQSSFVHSQLSQLESITTSPTFELSAVELFSFAQLILALSKFTLPPYLIELFINRAKANNNNNNNASTTSASSSHGNKSNNFVRHDQLVFIYAALLKTSVVAPAHLKNDSETLVSQIEDQIKVFAKQQSIPLVQIVKAMHEVTSIYLSLNEERKAFSRDLLDLSYTQFGNDIGLDIWVIWQQSFTCQDPTRFTQLYKQVERSITAVLNHLSSNQNAPNKHETRLKSYKSDMRNHVTDISIIQLYAGLKLLCMNTKLTSELDETIHQKISHVLAQMEASAFIKNYRSAVTVLYASNSETEIKSMLEETIKSEYQGALTLECEKKIGNIFFVDFFVKELNLIIECNGNQHYFNNQMLLNESVRLEYFKKLGYQVTCIQSSKWISLSQSERITFIQDVLAQFK